MLGARYGGTYRLSALEADRFADEDKVRVIAFNEMGTLTLHTSYISIIMKIVFVRVNTCD